MQDLIILLIRSEIAMKANEELVETISDRLGLVFRTKAELYHFLTITGNFYHSSEFRFGAAQMQNSIALDAQIQMKFREQFRSDSTHQIANCYLPDVKKVDSFFLGQILTGQKKGISLLQAVETQQPDQITTFNSL